MYRWSWEWPCVGMRKEPLCFLEIHASVATMFSFGPGVIRQDRIGRCWATC